jgi:PKD repeat protein
LELERTMRGIKIPFRLLTLAGVLSAVAWGCSTDSPTAPRQEAPPIPPGPGQVYYISVDADPGGIIVSDDDTMSTTVTVAAEVRLDGPSGPRVADGTTILLTTSLGSFSSEAVVREIGAEIVNGRVFATLFAGDAPVQRGIATVQAFLKGSHGEVDVPISTLVANFVFSNPESGFTVSFTDTSAGNPTSFSWNFDDGTRSTQRNPTHRYRNPGTYKVVLTVSKRISGVLLSSSTDPVDVTIAEPTP